MENSSWIEYKKEVRERLKIFAINLIEIVRDLSGSTESKVIAYQLMKSGTSVYANYRAALRGRSKAEFYSKLSISVEEADETEMWIDLLISSQILNNEKIKLLHQESIELTKILASMRKRLDK